MHTTFRRRIWRAFGALVVTSTSFIMLDSTIPHDSNTGASDDSRAVAPDESFPAVTTQSSTGRVEHNDPPSTCNPAATAPVPAMVGSIFRCRLYEAGIANEQVRQITAEAVVVAQCESEFDPNAIVFDGRYRHSPHPTTGSIYSAAGVFQFIRVRADRWIAGGYANVADPVANIDAAARLYLHNVRRGYPGWSDWACAAANDGFRATSVLPGWPGGPSKLPAWAFTQEHTP